MTDTAVPIYDKKDQLETVQYGLLQDEIVLAVYDGKGSGTGFIGITDKRIVLQDNSFIGKKTALTSVPYRHVDAVSIVSDKSMLGRLASSSTLAVSAGGKVYEIEFRGHEKAMQAHHIILKLLT